MTSLTVLLGTLDDTLANRSVFEMVRWMHDVRPEVDVLVLAGRTGSREASFRAVARTHVVNEIRAVRPSGALQHVRLHRLAEVARSRELRRALHRRSGSVWLPDLSAGHLLAWLDAEHVVAHQLAVAVPAGPQAEVLSIVAARTTAWLAGDAQAALFLERAYGAPAERITLRADFALAERCADDHPPPTRSARRAAARRALQRRHGIPADVPLVVGAGAVDFWAEHNAFAQLCFDLVRSRPGHGVHLVWEAEAATDQMVWPLVHDLAHAGLQGRVHITRGDPPPVEVRLAADVHVRPTLAHLGAAEAAELALLATPIVEFRAVGDDRTLAGRTAVPWPDVHAMRDRVLLLLADEQARHDLGEPPPDAPTDWDVRIGGPELLATLLEPAR